MTDLPAHFAEGLLAAFPDPLILVDVQNHTVVYANPEAERLYGPAPAGAVTCHRLTYGWTEPCPENGSECPLSAILETARPVRVEHVHRDDNGTTRYYLVQAAPVRDAQGAIRWVMETHTEITDQKADLVHQATHDSLTGVLNRGAMEALIHQEIGRRERGGAQFTVALLDLDNFKGINDRHGHEAGDRVLQGLSGGWGDRLRAADTLGRWGGEEFLMLLPNTDPEGGRCAAEELRRITEDLVFPRTGRVSVSIGVAGHQPGDGARRLQRKADDALYAAKEAGKNRVLVYDTEVQES